MIVVDASVWVAHFRDEDGAAVAKLRGVLDANEILVGDLVMLECLQGGRSEAHAARIEQTLKAFVVEPMLSPDLAVEAARHCRTLRAAGLTPRKTIDVIIASFCIRHGHQLLHQDRDFDPMVEHLNLRTY